jgi:DnaK suppressor protein
MNLETIKQQLLDLEKSLVNRTDRAVAAGRDAFIDTAHDIGDSSAADETASERFTAADLDSTTLDQVRDALRRLEDGTYGHCTVDGAPIEEKRLAAVPWTSYCLKHAERLEARAALKTPSM